MRQFVLLGALVVATLVAQTKAVGPKPPPPPPEEGRANLILGACSVPLSEFQQQWHDDGPESLR